MKSPLNPVSVGSFVIGAILLIIVGLLSFQSLAFFKKPVRFISYFNESVQGLDIGSSVKLRGVAVGRVIDIHVEYDWESNKSQVAVLSELDRDAMVDHSKNFIMISDRSILNKLIQNGLRAKIDLAGITGMQFIQLDFLDTEKAPLPELSTESLYPIIPTVDSGMSKLTDNLVAIAENVRKIDLEGISQEIKALLTSINKETKNLNLKKMVFQMSRAAESIQRLADFLNKHPSSLIFGR